MTVSKDGEGQKSVVLGDGAAVNITNGHAPKLTIYHWVFLAAELASLAVLLLLLISGKAGGHG